MSVEYHIVPENKEVLKKDITGKLNELPAAKSGRFEEQNTNGNIGL